MEDTLRGIQKGQQLSKSMQVLILILMEDTLREYVVVSVVSDLFKS